MSVSPKKDFSIGVDLLEAKRENLSKELPKEFALNVGKSRFNVRKTGSRDRSVDELAPYLFHKNVFSLLRV